MSQIDSLNQVVTLSNVFYFQNDSHRKHKIYIFLQIITFLHHSNSLSFQLQFFSIPTVSTSWTFLHILDFDIFDRFLFQFVSFVMLKCVIFQINKVLKPLIADITTINIVSNVLLFDVFGEISFLCICSIDTK